MCAFDKQPPVPQSFASSIQNVYHWQTQEHIAVFLSPNLPVCSAFPFIFRTIRPVRATYERASAPEMKYASLFFHLIGDLHPQRIEIAATQQNKTQPPDSGAKSFATPNQTFASSTSSHATNRARV